MDNTDCYNSSLKCNVSLSQPIRTVHYPDIGERMLNLLDNPHHMIASLIGLVAISLNLLVVLALHSVRQRLTCHHQLIMSLAASDMVVGSSVVLHIISTVLSPMHYPGGPHLQQQRLLSSCLHLAIKALNSAGLNMTLINLMLMAVEHFLAIYRPLRYMVLMNKTRLKLVILLAWLCAFVLGYSDLFSAAHIYHKNVQYGYNYCELVHLTSYQAEYTVLAVAPICMFVMCYLYGHIYLKIRRHRLPGYVPESSRVNHSTTKALVTTLLTVGTFVISWVPTFLFQVIMLIRVKYDTAAVERNMPILYLVNQYLFDLLILNALSDALIYAIRVKEVKHGLRKLLWCKGRNNNMPYDQVSMRRLTRASSLSVQGTKELK